MTAVSTRLLRHGKQATVTADDRLALGDGPDIYGHVTRDSWRARWLITAGKTGSVLAAGRTWTRGGAWVAAIAAAHKPGPVSRRGAR